MYEKRNSGNENSLQIPQNISEELGPIRNRANTIYAQVSQSFAVAGMSAQKRVVARRAVVSRMRKSTPSPRRIKYFDKKSSRRVKEETTQSRLAKVPLEEDEAFLKSVKAELLSLRKRVQHETLQKLELLKQIKQYKDKERRSSVTLEK